MALTVNSEMPTQTGVTATALSSVTYAFTNTAGTFIQMCCSGSLGGVGDTITSITYNGVEADTLTKFRSATNGLAYQTIGTLKNPATGANNVVVTFSTAMNFFTFGCISYTGQHATTPVGTVATSDGNSSGHHTQVVTSSAGNIVTGLYGDGCGIASVDGTLSWRTADNCTASNNTGACDRYAGAASVTIGFTDTVADSWMIMGMEIVAAAAAGGPGLLMQSQICL